MAVPVRILIREEVRDGNGGGISGEKGGATADSNWAGEGGSQDTGGKGGNVGEAGSFGNGANAVGEANCKPGGGGGWYGGGSSWYRGAGGGSGYIFTASSSKPTGYLLGSEYYLTNAQTIAGNQSFSAPGGGNETGHSGNGYARITLVE